MFRVSSADRIWVNLGANIDKTICTRWVGETYLEAAAPTADSAIERTAFINTWKDYLPESWRNEASVSKLTVRFWPCLYPCLPALSTCSISFAQPHLRLAILYSLADLLSRMALTSTPTQQQYAS